MPVRPEERPFPHDFRRLPGEAAGKYSPALRKQLRFARERQELSEYLYDSLGEITPLFKHRTRLSVNPETVGSRVRKLLNVSISEQFNWHDPYRALQAWRTKIEALSVLVFKFEKVDLSEALGFSIVDGTAPVIGINVSMAPRGQIFTMLHEFCHLMLRASSICDIDDYSFRGPKELRVEVFCNHVAAAALMPSNAFISHEVVSAHGAQPEWAEEEISEIAGSFVVSRESVVRRLLTFGKTSQAFYSHKRQEYQAQYKAQRAKNREANKGKPFARDQARRALSNFGHNFVQLVLSSYGNDRITLADAANYLYVRAPVVRRVQEVAMGD